VTDMDYQAVLPIPRCTTYPLANPRQHVASIFLFPPFPPFPPPSPLPHPSSSLTPQYHLVYGGWGLSHAVAPGGEDSDDDIVVLSTFHRTFAYIVAEGAFRAISGDCGGGVGAMTLAAADRSESRVVLLGRYSGEESIFGVFDLDLARLHEARAT
jgi:hypothetical protein